MLAQLEQSVADTCTEDTSPSGAWSPAPIALAECSDSGSSFIKTYARFKSLDDLNAAFDNFLNGSSPNSNKCPGFTGITWNYQGDPQSLTRGQVVCYKNSNSRPQLNFTFDSLSLMGVFTGNASDSITTVTNEWDNDDGIDPSAR